VTASYWLTNTDPPAMLAYLRDRGPVSERKLRLFAVAVASEVRHLMSEERSRDALRIAEEVADGRTDEAERAFAQELSNAARTEAETRYEAEVNESTYAESDEVIAAGWRLLVPVDAAATAHAVLHPVAFSAAVDAVRLMLTTEEWVRQTVRWEAGNGRNPDDATGLASGSHLAALLRDIFGNPFRPISFSREWRTEAVVALARGIYEGRAFERMPVLADAIEDAGCADPHVLEHCRGAGQHQRGCWVVDLVLGKK
jgi:hypothetical protein